MLKIKNVKVAIQGNVILENFSLEIKEGTCHAIMGPNGAGKSTLAKVLAGDPSYEVLEGEISFKGKDLLALEPEERAHLGLFMSFQYPLEISGVTNQQFLYKAVSALKKARKQKVPTEEEFEKALSVKMDCLQMKPEFRTRGINEGFSGGEKKKGEILQMELLEPSFSILDETDSGLDIDSMRVVSAGIERMRKEGHTLLIITHYQRLLEYVQPDQIHVMMQGKIVHSGEKELSLELEKRGYDWLKQ